MQLEPVRENPQEHSPSRQANFESSIEPNNSHPSSTLNPTESFTRVIERMAKDMSNLNHNDLSDDYIRDNIALDLDSQCSHRTSGKTERRSLTDGSGSYKRVKRRKYSQKKKES